MAPEIRQKESCEVGEWWCDSEMALRTPALLVHRPIKFPPLESW